MSRWFEELYDDTLADALAKNDLLFIDCYADWCGPCKAVGPVVERVAREYAGRVVFGKLNIGGNPLTARRMRVSSIPALIVFRDGKIVAQTGGYQSEAQLRACIDRYAPPLPEAEPPARGGGLLTRIFRRA